MQNISPDQILERARAENPWWFPPHNLPQMYAEWNPRPYLELLAPLVTETSVQRAVVLMGPRRVGKTVLIHHLIGRLLNDGIAPQNLCYFSVDHPIYNGLSLEDFLGFYQQAVGFDIGKKPCYVFFDEIQYLRDWERHLKSLVDSYPKTKFLVSGSAAAALKLKSSESGAGRFTDFMLPPLTFYEYLLLLDQNHLVSTDTTGSRTTFSTGNISSLNKHFVDYLNFGGYPEVIFSEQIRSDPGRFIKGDIIDKVLLRDLPSLYGIQDIQELNYLFTNLAFNTAGELSLEELAQGSGVAKNTIKKYIEYLEAAFLVHRVHRVDRNARRFKRANNFKVYLTNPSMRAALFSPVDAENDAMGALVETAIFSQWIHAEERLFYARWRRGEVDIINLSADQEVLWAVEAKWSDRYFDRPEELQALLMFCQTKNLNRALVTTKTMSGPKTIGDITFDFRPASLYCFGLGFNILSWEGRKASESDT